MDLVASRGLAADSKTPSPPQNQINKCNKECHIFTLHVL